MSQLFTRDWEIERRQLWVYDDTCERIRRQPARLLFSDAKSTTSEYEARLNALVETPIARHLEQLRNSSPVESTVAVGDWSVYRALVLALLLQGARAATKGRRIGHLLELERGIFSPDPVIDAYVQRAMSGKVLVRIDTPSSSPLFYPEVGFFAFPILDPGFASGFSFGFGLPVRQHSAFCLIGKTANALWLVDANIERAYLAQMSIGFSKHCRRWVVPPHLAGDFTEEQIADAVRQMRDQSLGSRRPWARTWTVSKILLGVLLSNSV